MSLVPLFLLNPLCPRFKNLSTLWYILSSIMNDRIFLVPFRSVIGLVFFATGSLFGLFRGISIPYPMSLIGCFSRNILLYVSTRCCTLRSPAYLISSAGISSIPAALPLFNLLKPNFFFRNVLDYYFFFPHCYRADFSIPA